MAIKTFNLPDPGEGLVEAEIVEWRVKPGDTVKVNDMVLEVETSKSLVELPIPWAGTVAQLLVEVGQTVDVGTPVITIDDGKDEPAAAPSAGSAPRGSDATPGVSSVPGGDEEGGAILVGYGAKAGASTRRARKKVQAEAAAAPMPPTEAEVPSADPIPEPQSRREEDGAGSGSTPPEPLEGERLRARAKPPVRKLAKDLGVDLGSLTPTGPDGIVTRQDVLDAATGRSEADATRSAGSVGTQAGPAASGVVAAPFGTGEREVRTDVKGVRKATATAMVGSAFTAPHVTEWVTLDVTATVQLVERLKRDREFRDVKVTPLLVLARALIVAIRRNPGINAVWDEANQQIVQKNYVNLGIAAATPRGLMVPNIKDAHAMDMRELAGAIGELTQTARDGRTQPAQMSGGTITITNVGVFGVDAGTPIINPGESAIVCFGAIRKAPWVITDEQGNDELAIRHVTTLALSFDHRLIDGELGSRFLADVAAILADPSRGLVWG